MRAAIDTMVSDTLKKYWRRHFDRKALTGGLTPEACDYRKRNFKILQKSALGLSGFPEGKIILDAGCGPGIFSKALAGENEVIGLDFSLTMLKLARTCDLTAVQGDVTVLPFKDNTFDVIYCTEVLQYLNTPDELLTEIMRTLKKGGNLLISFPNAHSILRNMIGMVFGLLRCFREGRKLKRYSIVDIVTTCRNVGLGKMEIVSTHYPFPFTRVCDRFDALEKYVSTNFILKGTKTD